MPGGIDWERRVLKRTYKIPWVGLSVAGIILAVGIAFAGSHLINQRKISEMHAYQARLAELKAKRGAWEKQVMEEDAGKVIPADKRETGLTPEDRAEITELLRRIAVLKADGISDNVSLRPGP